jgi:hypothetical protein
MVALGKFFYSDLIHSKFLFWEKFGKMIRRPETIAEFEKSLVLTDGTIQEDASSYEFDDIDLSMTKIMDGRDLFQLVKRTQDAQYCSKKIVDHIFDKAFAQIQENYYARKLPGNIIDFSHGLFQATLEMEF